jgi:hypothetical protein
MNLMYAPANLNNGIHRYKRKLGARVGNDWPYGQVLIKINNLERAVVSVFAHTPFAAVGAHGGLHARITIAQDGVSADDVRKLGAYYACEGFERVKIFSARPLSEQVLKADYAMLDGVPLELHDLTRSAHPVADFCRS